MDILNFEVLAGGSSILDQVRILLAFMVATNALDIAKRHWCEASLARDDTAHSMHPSIPTTGSLQGTGAEAPDANHRKDHREAKQDQHLCDNVTKLCAEEHELVEAHHRPSMWRQLGQELHP